MIPTCSSCWSMATPVPVIGRHRAEPGLARRACPERRGPRAAPAVATASPWLLLQPKMSETEPHGAQGPSRTPGGRICCRNPVYSLLGAPGSHQKGSGMVPPLCGFHQRRGEDTHPKVWFPQTLNIEMRQPPKQRICIRVSPGPVSTIPIQCSPAGISLYFILLYFISGCRTARFIQTQSSRSSEHPDSRPTNRLQTTEHPRKAPSPRTTSTKH